MKSFIVILTFVLALTNADERKKREAQFNQIYQQGSHSTNINNAGAYPGGFTGQQVYNGGSIANNLAYGKKKREAQFNQNYQPGSYSTNINNSPGFPGLGNIGYPGVAGPGYGAGFGSNFVQTYGQGSSASNIGKK